MKVIIRIFGIGLFSMGLVLQSTAQEGTEVLHGGRFLYANITNDDTLPLAVLPVVKIVARAPRKYRREAKKYNRLRNAVYVTYPYARIASGVLKDVDAHLSTLHTKKERKEYLHLKEEELKSSFGPKIKDLSIYQGKVLIKLIYRETGDNCYDLIKQMKGGFSARLWQTVAFVFGSNLKTPYDKKKNADIEAFVQEIEHVPFYYNAYYNRRRFN